MEYGLIGEKLGHSYSPEIHKLLGDYEYELREIPKKQLGAFMKAKAFKAINVTIPYKQDVIPYLDVVDGPASEIGAVNTIVNRDGRLYGFNTDFAGMTGLLNYLELDLKGRKVLILGSGGTSRTAQAVARSLGASDVIVVSRSGSEGSISYEQAASLHSDAGIIINATPCGMFPNCDASPIDLTPFKHLEGVVDAIYNPLRTNLVLQAQKTGCTSDGGLFMLVHQAICAYEHFFDCSLGSIRTNSIYSQVLRSKQNLVMIGMPGCGKSTVSEALARQLGRKLYDVDILIEKKTGMHPSQVIRTLGEDAFRDVETSVCRELASVTGAVISTGGGSVLRQENVTNLKHNGLLFFLDRPLEALEYSYNRPLSDSSEKLRRLYDSRYPVYLSCCDHHINAKEDVRHVVGAVLEAWK